MKVFTVERYRDRVLRDAALAQTGATMWTSGWPLGAPAAAEPPLMAGAINKEVALTALGRSAMARDSAIQDIMGAIPTRAANWG